MTAPLHLDSSAAKSQTHGCRLQRSVPLIVRPAHHCYSTVTKLNSLPLKTVRVSTPSHLDLQLKSNTALCGGKDRQLTTASKHLNIVCVRGLPQNDPVFASSSKSHLYWPFWLPLQCFLSQPSVPLSVPLCSPCPSELFLATPCSLSSPKA